MTSDPARAVYRLMHLAVLALFPTAVFAVLAKLLPGHPTWALALCIASANVTFWSIAWVAVIVHRARYRL